MGLLTQLIWISMAFIGEGEPPPPPGSESPIGLEVIIIFGAFFLSVLAAGIVCRALRDFWQTRIRSNRPKG